MLGGDEKKFKKIRLVLQKTLSLQNQLSFEKSIIFFITNKSNNLVKNYQVNKGQDSMGQRYIEITEKNEATGLSDTDF